MPDRTVKEVLLAVLTGGEASDYSTVPALLDMPCRKPRLFLADKGYDGDAVRQRLLLAGICPIILPKANRRCKLLATSGPIKTGAGLSECSTRSNSSVGSPPDTKKQSVLRRVPQSRSSTHLVTRLCQQNLEEAPR
ncbi:transposase [Labrenzia sp. VG12]|uniref:transposase n=1 Tax=Labrenzia sp. VG12 TaxID=2021862 RepID=UPI001FFD3C83|nr:transposase [Labrenzia sp. VG12]